ncbi:MAG TPA: hypothetical protein VJT49_07080 [Amycolatopsis sp.]|uniref:hypothetical protein n=1 Tax=Amycolatopsis sp. TaxID=37632 RepID=UPI002B46D182|nr:hypothetical protein [Amycolatopsis sp.]HKS44870.1 hypothetical protein [Amycolatopsis sp.]
MDYRLHTAVHHGAVDPEQVFTELFSTSVRAFWVERRSRFSFLGDDTGPLTEFCGYDEGTGTVTVERAGCPVARLREDVNRYLGRRLAQRRCVPPHLPFGFVGGWVGSSAGEGWLFADRVVVVDRAGKAAYLLCLAENSAPAAADAAEWLEVTRSFLAALPMHETQVPSAPVRDRWLLRGQDGDTVDLLSCH